MLEVYITKDGSPTLIFRKDDSYMEKMHHSGGAWTETLYIYYPAVEKAFSHPAPRLLSLGLGLGYNELMICAHELKNQCQPSLIHSFEIEPLLQKEFMGFLKGQPSSLLDGCHSLVLDGVSKHFQLPAGELRDFVSDKISRKELLLLGPYPESCPKDQKYEAILYDAFSSKMNPQLWSEPFLKSQFQNLCASDCVFATYAATGALKRALLSLNFTRVPRSGFSGKRDASFYLRGDFL